MFEIVLIAVLMESPVTEVPCCFVLLLWGGVLFIMFNGNVEVRS